MNNKFATRLSQWIKWGLLVLFVALICWQLFYKNDIGDLFQAVRMQMKDKSILFLVFALLMMPVNWWLETAKWLKLLPNITNFSMKKAFQAVLGGITLSLLTPNRIGEYGGRVLFVAPRDQWSAVIATLVGSFSQNLSNLLFGCMGLICMPGLYQIDGFSKWVPIFAVAGMGLLFVGYYNVRWIDGFFSLRKWPQWIEKRKRHLKILRDYTRISLTQALILSILRYLVFSLQFVLILHFFGCEIPYLELWLGVTLIYLFHTGIPLPPFVDVLARSEIALIIWQNYAPNELSIIFASFGIWIINLLIPAFFGLILIEKTNVAKALGYENEEPT